MTRLSRYREPEGSWDFRHLEGKGHAHSIRPLQFLCTRGEMLTLGGHRRYKGEYAPVNVSPNQSKEAVAAVAVL